MNPEVGEAAWQQLVLYLELLNTEKYSDRRGVLWSRCDLAIGRLIRILLDATEVVPFWSRLWRGDALTQQQAHAA